MFDLKKLEQALTTSDVAEMKGCTPGTVRRAAKSGEIKYAMFAGAYVFDPEDIKDWEPAVTSRGGAAARQTEDGEPLLRWKIWLTREQAEELEKEGFELENPREKARKRRAERLAAKEEAGGDEDEDEDEDEDDPFADFE